MSIALVADGPDLESTGTLIRGGGAVPTMGLQSLIESLGVPAMLWRRQQGKMGTEWLDVHAVQRPRRTPLATPCS